MSSGFPVKGGKCRRDGGCTGGAQFVHSIATTRAYTPMTTNDLNKLPVNGRNFTASLLPVTIKYRLAQSGQLASSTNYTIDGIGAKGPTSGSTIAEAVCHMPFRWRLSVSSKS